MNMAKSSEKVKVVATSGSLGAMQNLIRTGYLFFKLDTGEKASPQKKYIGLYSEAQESRPHIRVCRDERMLMSNIFLYKIIDEDVSKVKECRGEESWEDHSIKIVTPEVRFVFSAISKRERDGWLEDILRHFQRFKVQEAPVELPFGDLYENPYKYQTKFTVRADEGSQHLLGTMGTLTLMIRTTCLIIVSTHGNKLADFDTTVVRKCGFTPNSFHMIVGRRSMIGSAFLKFRTTEGKHIYRKMMESKYAVKMGKHLQAENTVPSSYESPVFTRPGHDYESCEPLDSQDFDFFPTEDPTSPLDLGRYLEPKALFPEVKTEPKKCESKVKTEPKKCESKVKTEPKMFEINPPEPIAENIEEGEFSPATESDIETSYQNPELLYATVSYPRLELVTSKLSLTESFDENIPDASPSPAAENVTAISHHGFKEHEWHIKTMMMIEYAKEFCNGDKKRFCEMLNGFLECHGMSPLEFEWGSAEEDISSRHSNPYV